jgi:hypothetical protein
VRVFGVDWAEALPLTEIAASGHRAAKDFREKRLVQWQAKLSKPKNPHAPPPPAST